VSEDFDSLLASYETPSQIPDSQLYDYIIREDVWDSLKNLRTLGTDRFLQVPIVHEVRRRSKADLYWLVKYFLWGTNPAGIDKPISENRITREEYQIVCDFFVKKDDRKTIAEQDIYKNRLLLWPRGGYKSTIDICDAVQWMLNFPDIRILFLTGVDDLAVGFVGELRGHFAIKDGNLTLVNIFFPEYCVEEKELDKVNKFEFTCPVWALKNAHRKEPTVLASSIGSTKSGLHFEVIKADDAVCDKNSESAEQCQTISQKLFLAKKLLRPGDYYLDYIGTRYADEDHYGVLLEKNVGEIATTRQPCWEYIENKTTCTKTLVGRAIVIKPERVLELKSQGKPNSYIDAGETGCNLLLPSIMKYSWLMREYKEDEATFEGQLNQNPRAATFTVFDREVLLQNTVPFTAMPSRGPVSQTWDFAFSKQKKRDYCTASSAIWNDKGQCFIHDLIRSRFLPYDLAKAVVDFACKYRPFVIGIENAAGSRLLEPAIIAEAKKTNDPYIMGVCGRIDWIQVDGQKDAKKIRIAALQPWLIDGRLKFASHLPFLNVLYEEFEKCLASAHHDDIPDVISTQIRYAPQMAQQIAKNDIQTWSQVEAGWKMLFEEGSQTPYGGFLLQMDPTSGQLRWITEPLVSPLTDLPSGQGMRAAPSDGLDPILGSGLVG
jgi:phage terminase large subunit-like protein